ncbi:hypothetical protein GGH93_003949 [Coemansia aciculifera]|nr:hypothetical protein GGH93_003949 [Coemansia aciculifera]
MSGLNLRILRSTEGANKLNGDYAECFEHDEVVQEGDSLGKVFNDISSFLLNMYVVHVSHIKPAT